MLRCGTDFTRHSSVPSTIQRSSISEADVTYRLTAELLLSAKGDRSIRALATLCGRDMPTKNCNRTSAKSGMINRKLRGESGLG